MDDLLILGCIIVFFALVVVPILAIVAFNRSATTRDELARLRRRVEELEQRAVAAPTVAQTTPTPAQPVETVIPTESVPDVASEPASPWRAQRPQRAANNDVVPPRDPAPAVAKPPSAFGGMITSLARWFMQGNPLAKLGILLLFLGLSFLLRYTVEHALFPLELRLVAAALFAIVLLAVGWRLRHRQPVYALILQGAQRAHSISRSLAPFVSGRCCR